MAGEHTPGTTELVEVTQADVDAAEDAVSSANVVTHDGYYELDIDAVAKVFASYRHRLSSTPDVKELVEALEEARGLFAHGVGAMTNNGDKANQERNIGEAKAILKRIRTALTKASGGSSHG